MSKFLGVALAGLTVFGCSAGALAAQQSTRIRGTVESVTGDTVTIKSYSGETTDLMLNSGTRFAAVLPSSLSNIRSGDFIGAGATGPESDLRALEIVIFPESMRGTGEGHYAWSIPSAVANSDARGKAQARTSAPPVEGTMTNGTVATNANKAGGRELTVSYGKGKKTQILVPPDAPVVRFAPAQRSVVVPGAKAFVVASKPSGSSELSANFVAIGKNGLMPPM